MQPNVMRPPQFSLDEFIADLPANWDHAVMAEIGCYQGESTAAFCKSGKFRFVYAIDPWKNEVYDPNDKATLHCDMEVVKAAFDVRVFPYGDMVQVLRMYSLQAAETIVANGVFDLVYIDGNHIKEAVLSDLTAWVPKVKPGGIISGHDYGTHPGVKEAVLEYFGRPPEKTYKDFSWRYTRGY